MQTEKVNISGKIADPDQEALEAGMLLSKQEAKYGTNMFDSIKEEDEAVISEYEADGFSRVEAIQMIFEDRYGKLDDDFTSPHTRQIKTMPHVLHRSTIQDARKSIAVPKSPKRVGSVVSQTGSLTREEMQNEVEMIMSHGYDREKATQIVQQKYNRQQFQSTQSKQSEQVRRFTQVLPNSSGGRTVVRVASKTENIIEK